MNILSKMQADFHSLQIVYPTQEVFEIFQGGNQNGDGFYKQIDHDFLPDKMQHIR